MIRILLAALALLLFLPELRARPGGAGTSLDFPAAPAGSRVAWPGPFRVETLKVKDGDTIEVRFIDGPCGRGPCPGQILAVRVAGVDAPEAHACGPRLRERSSGASCAACPEELELGAKARAFVRDFVQPARPARVVAARRDKYGGRIVAGFQVFKDGQWADLGQALLGAGLAVPYDGGGKLKPWCPA